MAALVEGQQYGLSAQDKNNCTKSVVFVKLTDSALRSIEEYVKNKGDASSRPTIQFQNSTGVISLPQKGSNLKYGFSLSNVEADGPHGSFECLRQTGYRSLESLGCLQMKMHIHATEDSYENTRVKMAAVEKEQKKLCTKVIKPAGSHLGRRIKMKRPGLVVSPMKSSPPTASMIAKPPSSSSRPSPTSAVPRSPPAPSLPYKRPDAPKPPPASKKNPELLRQPLRERIIHILAVRPYKRPELLVRLNHEGVREKDKNKLTSILPQISHLKGNIYYLANFLWNEVQDNWKFGTQEELEIIRKRKQQHLNTSSESEIASLSQPNNSPAQKRLSSDAATNGNPRSKKQRISHYKGEPQRPPNSSNELSMSAFSRKSPYSPGCSSLSTNSHEDDCDPSPYSSSSRDSGWMREENSRSPSAMSPRMKEDGARSRVSPPIARDKPPPTKKETACDSQSNSTHHLSATAREKNSLSPKSPSVNTHHPRLKEDRSRPVIRDKPPPSPLKKEPAYVRNSDSLGKPTQHQLSHNWTSGAKSPQVSPDSFPRAPTPSSKTTTNGYVNSITKNGYGGSQSSYANGRSKVTSTTNGSCSNSPHSSCDSIEYSDTNQDIQVTPPDSPEECDLPDYEKEYGQIVSGDQRAKYKAHFNAEYQEYLCLHEEIIKISNKFADLEQRLREYPEGTEQFMNIRQKIYKEYRAYQQDPHYIESLKKFHFLHNKLAYIKRLVAEYDNAQS